MITKQQRENLKHLASEWVKVAEDGDCLRFINGELVITDKLGCEISRDYV